MLMRVLIVEDEQDLQNILVKRLNAEHYSVDACGNGEDALDYINMATYDLIVLDIMIPGIDGLHVYYKYYARTIMQLLSCFLQLKIQLMIV